MRSILIIVLGIIAISIGGCASFGKNASNDGNSPYFDRHSNVPQAPLWED